MHQGEPGDRVLLLLDGHVKASITDSRGREMVLSFRGPGDVLGELTFSTRRAALEQRHRDRARRGPGDRRLRVPRLSQADDRQRR